MPLNIEIDEKLPEISMDATRISQVIDNLVSNASKYGGGSDILIRGYLVGDYLRIEVEDHGPGINPEHIPHLFERFYRVQESSQSARGTGLGLYICRKIIEAHDGEIGVASTPGEGSLFFFTLPIAQAEVGIEVEPEREV